MTQDDVDGYTPGQLLRVGAVYDFIARALPTEGRDYSIEFIFSDPANPSDISVKMVPHNKLGKIWCDYCTEAMSIASRRNREGK